MKKILVAGICLALSISASAQFISKGSMIGSGSANISRTSFELNSGFFTSKVTYVNFSVSPSALWFVADNFGVGASLSVSATSYNYKDVDQTSNSTSLAIGPVARYYFSDGPFVEGFIGVGSVSTNSESPSGPTDNSSGFFQTDFGFGYSIRINEFILFDPMIGHQFYKNNDASSGQGTFYLSAGFTMLLKRG